MMDITSAVQYARWRHTLQAHKRNAALRNILWPLLIYILVAGFMHAYFRKQDKMVADLAAARSQPCPYHCDCGSHVPRRTTELSTVETLYYATMGPTHHNECAEFNEALNKGTWPTDFKAILRDYIMDDVVAVASVIGGALAAFLYHFPYPIQFVMATVIPIAGIAILVFAPTLFPLFVASGWQPRRVYGEPQSFSDGFHREPLQARYLHPHPALRPAAPTRPTIEDVTEEYGSDQRAEPAEYVFTH